MKRFDLGSYKEYAECQINRSNLKWGSRTFDEEEFLDSIKRIREHLNKIETICCMGIRNGNEFNVMQESFKDCEVYGVDINPKVREVRGSTLCCDFNRLPFNWTDKFDFIYSNSLDHSFNIQGTILEWYRVCTKYMLLRFAKHEVNRDDVYSFSKTDIDKLFSKDKFKVIDVWDYNKPNFTGFFEVIK